MVNKRIKTKLIEAASVRNPRPGCLLDHTVTSANEYDFYIVCAETKQGVPTPTHFTVLRNEIDDISPEEVMQLCFRLCYTYYNCNGSVKVPSPVKYADKQAAFIGELRVNTHAFHEQTKGLYFI